MIQTKFRFDSLHPAVGCGLLLWGLLCLTFLLYAPGLSGPLLLDDYWNLRPLGEGNGIDSLDSLRTFIFSNTSGPTGRPVAMLSFVLDTQDWPPNIAALKYTNLLIHLLTGVFIFWACMELSSLLAASRKTSFAIGLLSASLWLLHPFNISTTLYIIQRMTQLMTLFSMIALLCYLKGRANLQTKPRLAAVQLILCLFPFGVLAVLSKENGALLLLLIFIFEQSFFRRHAGTVFFRFWYRFGVLLPLLIVFAYLLYDLPAKMQIYETRSFGLQERIFTEARILVTYIWKILIPNANGLGVYHDDYIVSAGLLSPVTTLLSIMLLVAIWISAWQLRKKHAIYSFAVFWFFGLHLLESTIIPLELYFEHRNYFPMIGPLFAVAWYTCHFINHANFDHHKRLAKGLVVIVLLFCGGLTWSTSSLWGNTLDLHTTWAQESPRSIRSQIILADYLSALGYPEEGLQRLQIAHENYPQEVTIILQMWNHSCLYNLPRVVTLQELVDTPDLVFHVNDVNQQLQALVENLYLGHCERPDFELLQAVFRRVEELPMAEGRRAPFYAFLADLHMYFGDLNGALINLTQAFQINATPELPVRQAILSASAGNFSDALIFLQRARVALDNESPLMPSIEPEIDRLEADFLTRVPQY